MRNPAPSDSIPTIVTPDGFGGNNQVEPVTDGSMDGSIGNDNDDNASVPLVLEDSPLLLKITLLRVL